MQFPELDRTKLKLEKLAAREDRVYAEKDFVDPDEEARQHSVGFACQRHDGLYRKAQVTLLSLWFLVKKKKVSQG